MKAKNYLVGLMLAASLAVLPVGMTACGGNSDSTSSSQQSMVFENVGEYYSATDTSVNADQTTVNITATDVTLKIGGETLTGSYFYDGTTLTATLSNGKAVEITTDGTTLAVKYDSAEYTFLKKVNYTVTFNTNGGSSVDSVSVLNGRKATAPANPTKTGYTFVGWYEDATCKTAYYDFTAAVTGDLTLYARFVETPAGQDEFKVKFVVDGVAFGEELTTIDGKVYAGQMQVPEKDGATFAGWWVSAYDDAEKLTYKYDEHKLAENTTLYAVWVSENPAVSVFADKISWTADGVNNTYKVTVKTDAGETVFTQTTSDTEVAVPFSFLEAGDYAVEVLVVGTQKATTAYYQSKALATVCNFSVSDNRVLTFNAIENAERYVLSIVCGDDAHNHTEVVLTTNSYDFSDCAMKAGGITFTVTAEKDGYVSSVSKTYVYEAELDAVSGLAIDGDTETASWNVVEGAQKYVVEIINNGTSLGTKEVTATSVSLAGLTGAIEVKVYPVARAYNSPETVSASWTNTRLATPMNVRLDKHSLVWDEVANVASYNVKIGDNVFENITENKLALTDEHLAAGATSYQITVQAVAADEANNSLYSAAMTLNCNNQMANTLRYVDGQVHWDYVLGVKQYGVEVDGEEFFVDGDYNLADVVFTKKGSNIIKVRAYDAANQASEWVSITVTAYEIVFDAQNGTAVTSVFKAEGDRYTIEKTTDRVGYTFEGWYNIVNGKDNGVLQTEITVGAADVTVYADWTAREFTLTLNPGEGNAVSEATKLVAFDSTYTLPIPTNPDPIKSFGGWYASAGGTGTRYTDATGASVNTWAGLENVTLYAQWIDSVIDFKQLDDGTYAVQKGLNASSVQTITIPATYNGAEVSTIESEAFASLTNLKTINIPDTVKNIYVGTEGINGTGSAFARCTGLENINVYCACASEAEHATKDGAKFISVDGVLFEDDETTGLGVFAFPNARTAKYEMPATIKMFDGTEKNVTVVPTGAFWGAKFTEIVIPATVTSINADAFNASSLEKVTFAASADGNEVALRIMEDAFQGCRALTAIEIPARLTDFDVNILSGCVNLKEVEVVGDPVTGQTATYSSQDGLLLSGDGTKLVYVPKGVTGTFEFKNTKINTIGAGAFVDCQGINKVIIPGHVKLIEANAFLDLQSLVEVQFAEDGQRLTIDAKAFHGCSLAEVTLPSRTYKVGEYAFGANTSLTEVTVNGGGSYFATSAFGSEPKDSVSTKYTVQKVTLGEYADELKVSAVFGNTVSSVSVHENNQHYSSHGGIVYNKTKTFIVYVPDAITGTVEIPDGVTEIGANAFANKNVTGIQIPTSVTAIGDYAFKNSDLATIEFKGEHAALTIGVEAFYNTKATTVALPEGTTTIGSGAFKYSKVLNLTIPSTVTSIATGTTEAGVEYFDLFDAYNDGRTANKGSNLQTLTVTDNPYYLAIDNVLYKHANGVATELLHCARGAVGTVNVAASITKIWPYAFWTNSGVTEIKSPEDGFTATNVAIGEGAFSHMTALETVKLSAGITTLPYKVFADSANLATVNVPYTVSSIAGAAFLGTMPTITYDETPTGVEEVGLRFEDADSQWGGMIVTSANLTLPARTVYIGESTFAALDGLVSVVIPANVAEIGERAFERNTSLKTVVFETTNLAKIPALAFERCRNLQTLTLPATGLTEIADSAFQNCVALTSVAIPASVTKIGASAFTVDSNSTSLLATVTLGENSQLNTIGANAFNRTALTEFNKVGENNVLPKTVSVIGANAFARTQLANITFEENGVLEKVEAGAFAYTKLTKFVLPESSKDITLGGKLFEGCETLTQLHFSSTVTGLGESLGGCTSYMNGKITVHENNPNMWSDPNQPLITNKVIDPDTQEVKKTAFLLVYGEISGTLEIPEGFTEVGSNAYANQTGITKVILPASLQTLGASAFAYCTNLTTVEFKPGCVLQTVGENAFKFCKSLQSIALPEKVTSVGNCAFQYCASLETATLPKNATSFTLGTSAFEYCTKLSSVTLPDSLTTLNQQTFSYCSSLETITLPANLKTFTSTTTKNACTFQYSGLKSVVIPNSVTVISPKTFYYCESLKAVTFPASLTEIGNSAFQYCDLQSDNAADTTFDGEVVVPDSVATFGNSVFANNTSLKNVTALGLQTKVGTSIFKDCTSLQSVTFKDLVEWKGTMFQNCTSLSKLYYIDKDGVKHEGLDPDAKAPTTTAMNIFQNSGLTSVVIPASWTTFGNIFSGCTKLANVSFAENSACTSLPASAFLNCGTEAEEFSIDFTNATRLNKFGNTTFKGSNLKSISLPNLTSGVGTNMFEGCVNLSSVQFANGWTKALSNNMFLGCTSLTSITLPEGLLGLGTNCFQNSGLTSISIPATITSIPNYAFSGCTNLASVTFNQKDGAYKVTSFGNYAFQNCSLATAFAIPNTVTSIGTAALYGTGLTEIKLPDGVTTVNLGALMAKNLTGVESVNFTVKDGGIYKDNTLVLYFGSGDENNVFTVPDDVTVAAGAFYGNTKVKTVVLPSAMTSLAANMFENFVGLESIVIPASVTTINTKAFLNCVNLTTVTFESANTLTTVGANAFEGCAKLAKLEIKDVEWTVNALPDSVTSLGGSAFKNTTALTSFTLPSNITTVPASLFQGSGLTYISIPKKITSLGSSAFMDSALADIDFENRAVDPEAATITYANLSIEASALKNTQLVELILPEGVKKFGSYAGANNTKLETLQLPDTLDANYVSSSYTIDTYAFTGCTALKTIRFNKTLKYLNNSMFENCTSLEEVVLPATLLNPKNASSLSVFAGCTSLRRVTILSTNMQTLPSKMFLNCTNLEEVILPSSITTIEGGSGSGVFSGCTSLTTINLHETALTTIKQEAFKGTNLQNVILPSTVTTVGKNAFSGMPSTASIKVAKSEESTLGVWDDLWNWDSALSVTWDYVAPSTEE